MVGLSSVAWWLLAVLVVAAGVTAWLFTLSMRGVLFVDLGWGRSMRPLGPMTVHIEAPRELVFEEISSPYLGRVPRELREKLEVLERSERMVLAAHRTKLRGLSVTTVETVRFQPPERVDFRLVRGPVPLVVEHFILRRADGGTELAYGGELGADLWILGRLWGRRVARVWERAVTASLGELKVAAEKRASARERRAARNPRRSRGG